MPLFGGKHKTPHELVKSVKDSLSTLSGLEGKDDRKSAKALEELSKSLDSMKVMLCGTGDHDPQADTTAQLAQEIYNSHLINTIIENMTLIDFEGRKDSVMIFNNLLRRPIGSRNPTVDHICQNKEILTALMTGYQNQELALNCGVMLRECFRYEELARIILHSDDFYKFFDYVEVSTFDISSDAFLTFKELLTRHKMLSAEFLEANYDKIFFQYQNLLNSENYVTRRQALKLLGELLLDRRNFTIMTRYIAQPENLKLMMNMLKESSKNIQFEAFHVFKVFVANPDKPRPIQEILLRNKDKLVEFLSKFHTDRSEDEQFNDEKAYLIKQIKDLKPLADLPLPQAIVKTAPIDEPLPMAMSPHPADQPPAVVSPTPATIQSNTAALQPQLSVVSPSQRSTVSSASPPSAQPVTVSTVVEGASSS